jgi:hypothetical protein
MEQERFKRALNYPITHSIRLVKKLINKQSFSDRIKKRHKIFWKAPNAEIVRNTIMDATDPIEKWKDVKNWQRKLSNKYNSREFAAKHNCKVAALYWKGRDYDSIDFDNLPDHYVIRPTIGHSSGLVFLMSHSTNLMDGKTYTKEDIKKVLAKALSENQRLAFLIEEFVRTEDGKYKIPDDYKLYTFKGEIACIQVINRLGPSKGYTTCYDKNWQIMENVNTYYPKGDYQQPPKYLQEMLKQAKELSKSYEIFVRIDFYATDKGAVFGEFTPTPFMGSCFTSAADKLFINYWDKLCKGKV